MDNKEENKIGAPTVITSEIVIKPISELERWDKNPKKANPKDLERLKAQIHKLGMYKPLIINQENIVLGGNQRHLVLEKMGVKEVACSVVQTDNESKMLEYALSDNDQVGRYIGKDLIKLVKEIPIDQDVFHVDMAKTWKIKDIVSAVMEEGDVPEPDSEPNNIKTRQGEVYRLGDHRLMCGDSTSQEDVGKLMNGEKARMVFTDPPYMVAYKDAKGKGIANDALGDEDASIFYGKVAINLLDFSSEDATLYWWFASAKQELNKKVLKGTRNS